MAQSRRVDALESPKKIGNLTLNFISGVISRSQTPNTPGSNPTSPAPKVETYELRYQVTKAAENVRLLNETLDTMFASNHPTETSLKINVRILLYRVLHTMHYLWQITLHRPTDLRLQHVTPLIRNLLINGITFDFRKPIYFIDDVALKLRDLALPTLEKISQETNPQLIYEKTIGLISELQLEKFELFSNQKKYTAKESECINDIKEAIAILGNAARKSLVQELIDYPDKTDFIKLMVVRIGAYWNYYCELNKAATTLDEFEGIKVVRLNDCRDIYTRIDHDVNKNAFQAYPDIEYNELQALINLAKALIAPNIIKSPVHFFDSPKPPLNINSNIKYLLSLKTNSSDRSILYDEIKTAFEERKIVSNEWLRLNNQRLISEADYSNLMFNLEKKWKSFNCPTVSTGMLIWLLSQRQFKAAEELRETKAKYDQHEFEIVSYLQSQDAYVTYIKSFASDQMLTENCRKLLPTYLSLFSSFVL